MVVRLKCDSLHALLAPETGGGIAAFGDGETMLMAPRGPDALCEFPMGPWVNRLADSHVHWKGEMNFVPRTAPEHAYPIHGTGWRGAWDVVAHGERQAVLRFDSGLKTAWPWQGVVMTRTFDLTDDALTVRFEITHDDPRGMPAALGLHPYFPVRDALVRLNARGYWRTINDIPSERADIPLLGALRQGAVMSAHRVDNCLDGWDGRAEIIWPQHKLTIDTDPPQRFVQLYAPNGRDYFCLEPQSAMPGGIGRDDGGYVTLGRGETFAFETRFVFARL
jgi:aldose 1-epimerase